jgi:hypothetical protein
MNTHCMKTRSKNDYEEEEPLLNKGIIVASLMPTYVSILAALYVVTRQYGVNNACISLCVLIGTFAIPTVINQSKKY